MKDKQRWSSNPRPCGYDQSVLPSEPETPLQVSDLSEVAVVCEDAQTIEVFSEEADNSLSLLEVNMTMSSLRLVSKKTVHLSLLSVCLGNIFLCR